VTDRGIWLNPENGLVLDHSGQIDLQ